MHVISVTKGVLWMLLGVFKSKSFIVFWNHQYSPVNSITQKPSYRKNHMDLI